MVLFDYCFFLIVFFLLLFPTGFNESPMPFMIFYLNRTIIICMLRWKQIQQFEIIWHSPLSPFEIVLTSPVEFSLDMNRTRSSMRLLSS